MARAWLLLCANAAAVFGEVEQPSFPGRSADMLLYTAGKATDKFLLSDGNGKYIFPGKAMSVDEAQLAPLLSHTMGLMSTGDVPPQYGKFVKDNMFHKPKSVLLMNVDDVDPAVLGLMPNLQSISKRSQQLDVSPAFQPRDAVSALTTVVSGVAPSTHGIVGRKWLDEAGNQIVAHADQFSSAAVATVADVLEQTYNGESLIVSASSDPILAAAAAVRTSLAGSRPEYNSVSVSFDPEAKEVKTVTGSEELSRFGISQDKLMSSIAAMVQGGLFAKSGVTVNWNGQTLTANGLALDTQQSEEMAFLSELALDYHVLQQLQQGKLVEDDAPDMVTLSMATVGPLLKKLQTAQQEIVLQLLDSALDKLQEQFVQLYNKDCITGILLRSTLPIAELEAVKAAVHSVVASNLANEQAFDALFPAIYLASNTQALCELVAEKTADTPVQVHCVQKHARRQLTEGDKPAPKHKEYTHAEIDLVHITLWSSLGMVFACFFGVMALMNMDTGNDTMLNQMVKKDK